MTAITFPTTATVGQSYVATNAVTYVWTGDRWSASRAITNNQAKYYVEGGDSSFSYNENLDGLLDGGFSDGGMGVLLTIVSSFLTIGGYGNNDGTVTYNIDSTGATEAGIIINGITVSHTQTITGTFAQGNNTVSWSGYDIDNPLWGQMASVTAYVVDSNGYTFYALVEDLWDIPYGPCLVAGTLMSLANGSQKKIEDITYDDVLSVWNFDLGELSEARPLWVKRKQTSSAYTLLKFSDGTELKTVGHHIFNKQAGEFTKIITDDTPVGTVTVNEQGQEITIVSKEIVKDVVDYYNIWTQYHLNAYANGVLTGNRYCNVYPVVDMKYVKDDRAPRSVEEFKGIDSKYISGMRLPEQTFDLAFIQTMVDRIEALDSHAVTTA
jgi:hypothetical protein